LVETIRVIVIAAIVVIISIIVAISVIVAIILTFVVILITLHLALTDSHAIWKAGRSTSSLTVGLANILTRWFTAT